MWLGKSCCVNKANNNRTPYNLKFNFPLGLWSGVYICCIVLIFGLFVCHHIRCTYILANGVHIHDDIILLLYSLYCHQCSSIFILNVHTMHTCTHTHTTLNAIYGYWDNIYMRKHLMLLCQIVHKQFECPLFVAHIQWIFHLFVWIIIIITGNSAKCIADNSHSSGVAGKWIIMNKSRQIHRAESIWQCSMCERK